MTRQEAIARVGGVIAAGRDTIDGSEALLRGIIVDSVVALGLLKLDEPKTRMEKIGNLMEHFGITCYSPIEFENWARVVGLNLVEK